MWRPLIMLGCDIVISSLQILWPVSDWFWGIRMSRHQLPRVYLGGLSYRAGDRDVEHFFRRYIYWTFCVLQMYCCKPQFELQIWKTEGDFSKEWLCLCGIWRYQGCRGCSLWPPWGKLFRQWLATTIRPNLMGWSILWPLFRIPSTLLRRLTSWEKGWQLSWQGEHLMGGTRRGGDLFAIVKKDHSSQWA